MAQTTIAAKPRKETGTHAVDKLRREGKIPGVVYGHQFGDPLPIVIEARDLRSALQGQNVNAVFTLEIEGRGSTPVMVHERQLDVVTKHLVHVDLHAINLNEEVEADVALVMVGAAPGVKEGGVLDLVLRTIAVEALPSDIPDHIDVDVSAMSIGDTIHVRDLPVPAGVKVMDEADEIVCTLLPPQKVEEEVPVAAAAEIVEPELIGEKKPEEAEPEAEA
jgi:large subunit ribosomal protein L25